MSRKPAPSSRATDPKYRAALRRRPLPTLEIEVLPFVPCWGCGESFITRRMHRCPNQAALQERLATS